MGGKRKRPRIKRKIKSEWEKKTSAIRFPNCVGIYDDCPSEEELQPFLKKKDEELLPEQCRKCPFYFKYKLS
ncbi:MAG TPA: hypothetical protein ENG56_01055 [Candidatus Aenigmarchaeota archaeon]|nr:MAG: hypothetical protein DRN63_01435 [Nanoarchaeota archaeon]HDN90929.1 hypothetical protein [Candidatus Aenigmarchaeota archaeon]